MNRRTFLGRSTNLSVAVPLTALSVGAAQKAAGPSHTFYGEFGRAIEEEFRHQQDQVSRVMSSFSGGEPKKAWLHFVVADLGEGELSARMEKLLGEKDHRDSYYGFFILSNGWIRVAGKIISKNQQTLNNHLLARRLCDVFAFIPSLDERGHDIKDDLPVSWRNKELSIEQKQIVWELLKLS